MKMFQHIKMQLLTATVVSKARLGFSITLVVLLTVAGNEALQRIEFFRQHFRIFTLVLALVGFLIWIIGRFITKRENDESLQSQTSLQTASEEHPLSVFTDPRYLSIILMISAGAIYLIASLWYEMPTPQIHSESRPKRVIPAIPAKTNVVSPVPVSPVVFPQLKLQGLAYNSTKSTAVVNGYTFGIGERIGDVRVVAIGMSSVTVEMAGRQRVIFMQE